MDSVVAAVVEKFKQRSEFGQKKYLDRKDLTVFEWANHMQEELMDAILYLEKLKRELSSSTPDQPFRS
jgi:tRNA A37 threonylcarbamoyladenosine biosynthesis protein TsaE